MPYRLRPPPCGRADSPLAPLSEAQAARALAKDASALPPDGELYEPQITAAQPGSSTAAAAYGTGSVEPLVPPADDQRDFPLLRSRQSGLTEDEQVKPGSDERSQCTIS